MYGYFQDLYGWDSSSLTNAMDNYSLIHNAANDLHQINLNTSSIRNASWVGLGSLLAFQQYANPAVSRARIIESEDTSSLALKFSELVGEFIDAFESQNIAIKKIEDSYSEGVFFFKEMDDLGATRWIVKLETDLDPSEIGDEWQSQIVAGFNGARAQLEELMDLIAGILEKVTSEKFETTIEMLEPNDLNALITDSQISWANAMQQLTVSIADLQLRFEAYTLILKSSIDTYKLSTYLDERRDEAYQVYFSIPDKEKVPFKIENEEKGIEQLNKAINSVEELLSECRQGNYFLNVEKSLELSRWIKKVEYKVKDSLETHKLCIQRADELLTVSRQFTK